MQPWQRQRLEFNHKWLKNSYLPALGRFINLLRDEIEDDGFEQIFLTTTLPAWEGAYGLVTDLCSGFEREMSPRQLLAEYPLSLLDADTKQWLGEVLHHVWLARFPVHEWIRDVTARTTTVHDCYQQIAGLLQESTSPRTVDLLRSHAQFFEQLCQACQDLARAVERFPRSILLI